MKKYAPVYIPTLCRYNHFRKCVQSLSECTHARYTDLHIGLDFPSKVEQEDGHRKIESYIREIDGFASVNVIKHESNVGAEKNWFGAMDRLFNKYSKLIMTEDDNTFAPNFLEYMNTGMNIYEKDPEIYAICAYNYPIEYTNILDANHYKSQNYSAWGVGHWRDKYDKYRKKFYRKGIAKKQIVDLKSSLQIAKSNFRMIRSLLRIAISEEIYADVLTTYGLYIMNMYCVFPVISKVKNHGHDGSGVHSKEDVASDRFKNQKIDSAENFRYSIGLGNKAKQSIDKELEKYFHIGFLRKLAICMKYIATLVVMHADNRTSAQSGDTFH